jgi:Na+-translocating ferredoxin:NAD+ oxidoreductase subunit G
MNHHLTQAADGAMAAKRGQALPQQPNVPSLRLLGTLGGAGALAGLLIVIVYQLALPRIEENRARALDQAVTEVLGGPSHYTTLYLYNEALTEELPAGVDARALERVYLGYHEDGRRAGFAIAHGEAGFADVIRLTFGYDPATRQILGMKVLDSKETPGLGDKIEHESFVSSLVGALAPLVPTKPGTSAQPNEVDTITGATISARTVMRIINNAVARWAPLLEAYQENPVRQEVLQ